MSSDGNKSDASSDLEATSRSRKRSGKAAEKKKKHEKHKKHKKSKKHKKHRHLSDAESDEKSGERSDSPGIRKKNQQPAPDRYTGKEAKEDRGLLKEREPPAERPKLDREEKQPKQTSSRWDSPAEVEGRSFHPSQNYDKGPRPRPQLESRGESSYQDERQHREYNRRRSPAAVQRSRSPSASYRGNRGEYKRQRRYSDEDNGRGGDNFSQHDTGSSRYEEHYRGNRNGREYRAASSKPARFDDRRPKRNDNYGEYGTGGGLRRTQDSHFGGGGDDGYQRRYSPPNHSYRGHHQYRGRGRMYPTGDRDDRYPRNDFRNDYRDQRFNRGSYAGPNRGWRGHPDDRDRNRRGWDQDRDRDRDREESRGRSRPVEVKTERRTSSPVNSRGRSRSHSAVHQSSRTESTQRNANERSSVGRIQKREVPRADQVREEDQFEWGGGRKDADNKSQSKHPPGQRIKGEEQRRGPKEEPASDSEGAPPKQKPDFGLSGKLTEETNTVNGTVIAYSEPPGARKPKRRWRLYPFKGETALPTLYIHRQSCYLIGRDRKVCDLPVDHPSCSKQHAALQYRLVPYVKDDGSKGQRVRPYIIDLASANGTFVNNDKIEPNRYVELLEKDVLKFGFSSREYVVLHENSKEDNEDDDGYEVSPTSKPFAGANSNVGAN